MPNYASQCYTEPKFVRPLNFGSGVITIITRQKFVAGELFAESRSDTDYIPVP